MQSTKAQKDLRQRDNRNVLYLLSNLISKDFKLKYRRSILGVAWSMLNALLMVIVMMLIFYGIMPSWKIVATPVLITLLTIFTLDVGYLVAALSVFFRDVMHLWGVLMTVWFYFTPIFWALRCPCRQWLEMGVYPDATQPHVPLRFGISPNDSGNSPTLRLSVDHRAGPLRNFCLCNLRRRLSRIQKAREKIPLYI